VVSRRLEASFEGPDIETVGVPVDKLLSVLDHLQTALRRMVESLAGATAGQGRLPDSIRKPGSLSLTGTRRGSLVAELELANPSEGSIPDLGVDAFDQLMENIESPELLPRSVAKEVSAIQAALDDRVPQVSFSGGDGAWNRTLRRSKPEKHPIERESKKVTMSGRIMEVDWRDRTAELHTPSGVVRLGFAESLGQEFKQQALQPVSVIGHAQFRDGDMERVEVETLGRTLSDESFWRPKSVVELAQEQGVKPFQYTPKTWTDEDARELDAFLDAVLNRE
jgi:hypothetical protein